MSAQRKAGAPAGRTVPPTGRTAPRGGAGAAPTRSRRRRLLTSVAATGLGILVLGGAAFAYAYATTDLPDPNREYQTQTTYVYYADGKTELGRFVTQNRESIPLAEVPTHVQDAVIAAENRSFWTDRGIDPKGILRAAFSNATSDTTQGASTITQQYVKVLYLSQERTLTRKLKEALLSLKIQRQMDKPEILQGYLNTIYFGRGAYGIQAAAQAFFEKDAEDLDLREGAALAAILNSPENLDPGNGTAQRDRLLLRYRYVLDGMAEMEVLDPATAEEAARRLPRFPRIRTSDQYGGQRGHMLMLVKRQLLAKGFTEQEVEGGGLRVTTTFTRKAMHAAAEAVREQRPDGLRQLHVAVASVEPGTGALRGMYGGQDYLDSQINWAVAGGQPGSSFKPFALAAGLRQGFSLFDTFDGNSPYYFPDGTEVENQGDTDYGSAIDLVTATANSVNTAYVDLTMSLDGGPKAVVDTAVDLGVPRRTPGLEPVPTVALGSATVSPIDMAGAYATIADGGRRARWYVVERVVSPSGKELYRQPGKRSRVLSEDIAADVTHALRQVVQWGSGTEALALGRPAAGKTGTATNDAGDVSSSWFVGFTPQLATAVMYVRGDGNDALDGYLPTFYGGDYPARTWTAMMSRAMEGLPVEELPPPAWVDGDAPEEGHAPVPVEPEPEPTYEPEPEPEPTVEPEPSTDPTSEEPTPTVIPEPEPTTQPTPEPSPSPTARPSPPAPTGPTVQPGSEGQQSRPSPGAGPD